MNSQTIVKENANQVSVYFSSLIELMNYQSTGVNKNYFDEFIGRSTSSFSYNRDWFGPTNKNANDVLNHALLGDEKLYQDLQNKIADLDRAVGKRTTAYQDRITKVKRQKIKTDFGDELDIHKVYQGQLYKAWARTRRVEVDSVHHLVTILINYAGLSDESATASIWRSAIAVKLVDDLMSAGKSVKLICGNISSNALVNNRRHLSTTIVIKNYNERLSLSRLAAMTHLGFFRTAGFAMKCSQQIQVAPDLGYTMNFTDKNIPLHILEEIEFGHTKYIPIGRASSFESAVTELEKAYMLMKEFSRLRA